MNSIKLASRLTDILYQGNHIDCDSAQALFDVLSDVLVSRPDISELIASDVEANDRRKAANLARMLDDLRNYESDDYALDEEVDNMGKVIPFIKDKQKRDQVKDQFERMHQYTGASRIQQHLQAINEKMAELRRMSADFTGTNPTTSNPSGIPLPPVITPPEATHTAPPPELPNESTTPTLDEEELQREYKRKQDEMRKKREQNNINVTRDYNLHGPNKRK